MRERYALVSPFSQRYRDMDASRLNLRRHMFERLTDQARKAFAFANQTAMRMGHEYIGTEHVLLGIIQVREGAAMRALHDLDVDPGRIRQEVESMCKSGGEALTSGKLSQTPRAKRVLELALEESRQADDGHVGTGHLLIRLILEGEGVAASVLGRLGVNVADVREAVRAAIAAGVTEDLMSEGSVARSTSEVHQRVSQPDDETQAASRRSTMIYIVMASRESDGSQPAEVQPVYASRTAKVAEKIAASMQEAATDGRVRYGVVSCMLVPY